MRLLRPSAFVSDSHYSPTRAPSTNGLSFLKTMELLGLFPSKTFQRKEIRELNFSLLLTEGNVDLTGGERDGGSDGVTL